MNNTETISLGKVQITPRGSYNPETMYHVLDIVTSNGSSYLAIEDSINVPVSNESVWMLLAHKGDGGTAAGFGTPTAEAETLPAGSDATAAVSESGTDDEKVFAFIFGIPKGETGKTAYEAAVEAGYEKTEAEFNEELSNLPDYVSAAAAEAETAVNAKNAAVEAKDDAIDAKNDAVSAKNYAETAATNAAASESAAATSKTNAAASATSAENSATMAASSETSASSSAASASAASAEAQAYIDTAKSEVSALIAAAIEEGTAVVIDPSLAISGAAAESKTVGDALELKATKAALDNTNNRLKYLYELTKGQSWDISTDSVAAYQKTVPTGAKAANIAKIGGKSVAINQLWEKRHFDLTDVETGTAKYLANTSTLANLIDFVPGEVYYMRCDGLEDYPYGEAKMKFQSGSYVGPCVATGLSNRSISAVSSAPSSDTNKRPFVLNRTGADIALLPIDVYFVNLTKLYGSGNEPSSVSDARISDLDSFLEISNEFYSLSNEIVSADVDGIVSKDDEQTEIGSIEIPQALRTDHPLRSIGTVHDEYDFGSKTYSQRIGSRAHQEGDEDDPTVLTDGTTTLYQLAEATVTDISSYLPAEFDPMLQVEAGGTLTFQQTGSEFAVPNSTDYFIKLEEAVAE